MKILPNKINKFFDSILSKLSVPKKDRNLLIKSLLDSSIRGVDSHGIRLFSHYVKCIENGRIKAKPKMKLIKKNRGVAVYDADDGLGHVAAFKGFSNSIIYGKEEWHCFNWHNKLLTLWCCRCIFYGYCTK